MLKKVVGQSQAVRILENSIRNDKIAQAYIFHGPDGCGKLFTAYLFAMAINCYTSDERTPCGVCPSCVKFLQFCHPDLAFIFPIPKFDITPSGEIKSDAQQAEFQKYIKQKIEKPHQDYAFTGNTEIRIDQIRMLQQKLLTSPFEAKKRIILIENADQMNVQAANAFLKTLEEPTENTIIIMTAVSLTDMLPTILSRCQKIEFFRINPDKIELYLIVRFAVEPVKAKLISRIANGNLQKAIQLALDETYDTVDITSSFFQIVYTKDDLNFFNWLDELLTRYTKNTTALNEVISSFIIFLRDIQSFQLCQNSIVNINQLKLISHFFERNPLLTEELPDMIKYMEDLQGSISGFVQPKLVFSSIYNRLKKLL